LTGRSDIAALGKEEGNAGATVYEKGRKTPCGIARNVVWSRWKKKVEVYVQERVGGSGIDAE